MMKTLSLSFLKQGDSRKPIGIELMIQDEADGRIDTLVRLDEHQFAALLSGAVVRSETVVG